MFGLARGTIPIKGGVGGLQRGAGAANLIFENVYFLENFGKALNFPEKVPIYRVKTGEGVPEG